MNYSGKCSIDLFASKLNAKLPSYVLETWHRGLVRRRFHSKLGQIHRFFRSAFQTGSVVPSKVRNAGRIPCTRRTCVANVSMVHRAASATHRLASVAASQNRSPCPSSNRKLHSLQKIRPMAFNLSVERCKLYSIPAEAALIIMLAWPWGTEKCYDTTTRDSWFLFWTE